jgi:hypothetical protein
MFRCLGKQFSCAGKPSFRARSATRSAALSRKAGTGLARTHTFAAFSKNLPSGSARIAPATIDAGN